MGTIDVRANRSSVFARGTYDTGGGQDDHMPVADSWSGLTIRSAFDFPKISWSGVTGVTKALLELTTTSQVHVARGSSPQAEARRITEQWTPNNATDDGGGNWTTSPDAYPGPSTTSSGAKVLSGADANERTESFDVTAIVRAWAPSSAGGSGAKQYGIALIQRDGSSRIAEWYSAEYGTSSKRPRLIITTQTTTPPATPTLQAPLGTLADGRTYRFATNRTPTSWDVDVATDSAFANLVWSPRSQTGGITGAQVAAPYAGPAYVAGTPYWWRARVRDAQGTSAWSAKGSFTADPNPTGRDPWEEWAGAMLDSQSDPRLALMVGTVRPEGAQVAALATADMGTVVRLDLSDARSPLRASALLVGLQVALDPKGWTLTPVLGSLSGTADDWYGSGSLYPERVLAGLYAPIPASYWGLGEVSGSFADQVGGFVGTVLGSPTRGVAPLAGADGALRGDAGHGCTYGNLYSNPGAGWSVAAWITWDGVGEHYIVDKIAVRTAGGYTGWRVAVAASDGSLRMLTTDPTTGAITTVTTGAGFVVPGVRYHVAFVRDAVGMRIYRDGALVKTGPPGPASYGVDAAKLLTTGANGVVDELGLWRVALTDDQVRDLWRG